MKILLTCAAAWFMAGGMCVISQTSPAPTSDNPTAGLNLAEDSTPKPVSGILSNFNNHLVVLDGNRAKSFDPSSLTGVKYWAFYYSASWCPPCRAFTPKLVEFYSEFKVKHPNFELIFVNHDRSADAMFAYMQTDAMPWPAVRFEDIDQTHANRYCGPGIPDLVLVDNQGKVLSDSFNGSDYIGPYQVIEDIKKLVP